jgi:dTDP-4-dehydrorhamnose reductase
MAKTAKILVLGSEGMLGQAVVGVLAGRGWAVSGTQFLHPTAPWYLDATAGPDSWEPLFAASQCDYVINCIGILKNAVDESDAGSVQQAIRVNALFPYEVAQAAAARGARVLHISTDGVFAGGRAEPYRESDPPDCTDHYGRTKALGECRAPNVLNIRCSIVGRDWVEHKGLLEWLLCQPEGGEVQGFRDQLWNGVTTVQFAQLCEVIIEHGAFDHTRRVSPVHHFCPNPIITKYDLLCAWRDVTGKQVAVRAAESRYPGGSRVLATQYDCLPSLYPPRAGWREILRELPLSGS